MFFPTSVSEGHIPPHKALFSFVLWWKLKELLKIECSNFAFVKLLAVTDRSAALLGAAAHNLWQPHVTEARSAQYRAVVSLTSLTDRCMSPDCLELLCLWKACVHILPTWLGDTVTEKFYPEDENYSEGAGRTGCTWQLGIRVHCTASFTARVLKL